MSVEALRADVRAHDYGRYCCALFAPPAVQSALIAILGLDLEVGRVTARVTEPAMGQLRLIWWRDTLDQVYAGAPPRHPVAEALTEPVADHGLSRGHFDAMLAARLAAVGEDTAGDAGEGDEAGAPPLLLWLEVLGVRDAAAAHAAAHVGRAWTLVRGGRMDLARQELTAARALHRAVPRAALPALLPATLVQRALRRGPEDAPGLGVPLALLRAALFGRY